MRGRLTSETAHHNIVDDVDILSERVFRKCVNIRNEWDKFEADSFKLVSELEEGADIDVGEYWKVKPDEARQSKSGRRVKLPKPKPRFLLANEVNQFLKAAEGDRLYALFVVAVHSGMRPSELLALRWQDVNMETGLVSIQRALKWNGKGQGYQMGGLKTNSSQRCIVLPASAIQAIAKHRIAQHEERLSLGSDYEGTDLVFCTSIGTPLQPRNVVGRHLKPILCKAFCPKSAQDWTTQGGHTLV